MVFWCLRFPPKNKRKQVDMRYHSSKVEVFRSFFGGNRRHQKPFQNYLIFRSQNFFFQIYGQILHQVWFSISVLDVDEQVRPFFGHTNQGLYKCTGCGEVKTAHSNLRNHIDSKHLHLKLICKLCHGVWKTRRSIHAHIKYHHKDKFLLSGLKANHYYTIE